MGLAASLAAILLVAAVALLDRAAPATLPDHLRLTFLDVGQGDATLVQHGGAAALVDTGPPDGPVLRRLKDAGVRPLDLLVITHAQADHDGRAPDVLRTLPVAMLLDGRDGVRSPIDPRIAAALRNRHVRDVRPEAGMRIRLGPAELRVLSPRQDETRVPGEDPNQRAIVLELRDGRFRALLTADAESDVLTGLDLRPVDVLKVSHHGSADEGLAAMLPRLAPRVAVVPVGRGNTYGHPVPATMSTLKAGVGAVYRTDRDGSVRIDAENGRLEVKTGV